MKESVEKMILEAVNTCASVMPLFKTGYAYSQVLGWCKELEERGLLGWSDDDLRTLTPQGMQRLLELNKKPEKTCYLIKPLIQYKIDRKRVEDIYLP